MEFLVSLGFWGMLITGFLAGSFFPFSSEAVLLTLLGLGLDPILLIVYASIGNVAGGMFNYWVGRQGNIEWIIKYMHVKEKNLNKVQNYMVNHGAWIGFFSFIPVLGSAITIALGLMHANVPMSIISITVGKVARYIVLVYAALYGSVILELY